LDFKIIDRNNLIRPYTTFSDKNYKLRLTNIPSASAGNHDVYLRASLKDYSTVKFSEQKIPVLVYAPPSCTVETF